MVDVGAAPFAQARRPLLWSSAVGLRFAKRKELCTATGVRGPISSVMISVTCRYHGFAIAALIIRGHSIDPDLSIFRRQ